MQKPPTRKIVHIDSVKTTMRIPRPLHVKLQEAADSEARSLNAEILIRLQSSALDDLRKDIVEIKIILRKLADQG